MLQFADENAVTASKPSKFGDGDGLCGVKDTSKAFAKAAPLPSKFGVQPSKSQLPLRPRAALGDLTNSLKRTPFVSAKPAQPSARPTVSEPPIEHQAGKGWRDLEKEIFQQSEAELQKKLDRIAAAAINWTTSHIYSEDYSSDCESDFEESVCERYSESPVVVQLLAPRHALGVTVSQSGSGFDNELCSLLPDIFPAKADFDLCWADDDDA